ncbi:MAG: dTDP-4-dehydrorhamnose 3,5-epimerase [bacterium]|nr:dTDP-4-dehydrorhamnose 3,5-epimerase [bacterium]
MKVSKCKLDGILIIEPDVFEDNRGFFLESYNRKKYEDIGIGVEFVQDNHSASTKGTLRGLHYQLNPGQSKLVRASLGEVFDVVVDVRKESPTFGQWESFIITAKNKKQIFIPRGFAHGFCVLSEYAEFLYKCDEYYSPKDERGFLWDDPEINVNWPISKPVLSKRDLSHPLFKDLSESDLF